MTISTHYSPSATYDVKKRGQVVGRLVAGTFYAYKNGRGFNFARVAGGLEGERFFYDGKPVASLIEGRIVGDDGTVLELERVNGVTPEQPIPITE